MDPQLQSLTQRIYQLEQEVAALKARLGVPNATAQQPPPAAPVAPVPRPALAAKAAPAPKPPQPGALEENLVGTWFPRIGAVAILIGAGFAFKYAVDRGLIGPSARVGIGVLVGLAFILWGRYAHGRRWEGFSQAMTAGGIALLYLSTLAAFMLYELISASAAFWFLTIIAVVNALLALYYNSLALAVMATLGGFINPFLVGEGGDVQRLYIYVIGLDFSVVGLALFKRWRPLDILALGGTWIVFAVTAGTISVGPALGFATVFFLIFAVVPLARTVARGAQAQADDIFIVLANAIFYFAAGTLLLDDAASRGSFVLMLGMIHLGSGLVLRKTDRMFTAALLGLAAFFFVVWVPFQVDGFLIPTGWAVEATLLVWFGRQYRNAVVRLTGVGVMGLAYLGSLSLLFGTFDPERLLLSAESANVAIQIAALYMTSVLLSRSSKQMFIWGAIAANVLTLVWLTAEAAAYFERGQTLQLTVSAIWTAYATALLVIGVAARIRWTRLLAVALFGLTIAKMSVVDLWFLPTGFRFLAFFGIGIVLILCSVMFHRFKEFILGSEAVSEA